MKPNFKYAWAEAKSSLMLGHILLDWKGVLGGLFLGVVAATYSIHLKIFDYTSMVQYENFTWLLFSVLTILFIIISFVAEKFLRGNISIANGTKNIAIWFMNTIIASYAMVVSLSIFEAIHNKNFPSLFNIYLYLYYADHFIKIKNDYIWNNSERVELIITVGSRK